MTHARCPVCGRSHAPGACPTSGAGGGAPRSILTAQAPAPQLEWPSQPVGEAAFVPDIRPALDPVPLYDLDVGMGQAVNARVAARYYELMRDGKHGHYETMFRIVAEEIGRARPPVPTPTPPQITGPAPWHAPKGTCRSCDRRRESQAESVRKKKGPKVPKK